ncbi:hypothetical protein F4X10_18485 [Candidatus Poribacteria bacterium]|nr:hypothetical protein [Candidatus Poribacteria bacterium]
MPTRNAYFGVNPRQSTAHYIQKLNTTLQSLNDFFDVPVMCIISFIETSFDWTTHCKVPMAGRYEINEGTYRRQSHISSYMGVTNLLLLFLK